MFQLSAIELQQLARRVKDDIDSACVKIYTEDHRSHLGASIIGDECGRKIWYVFRWAKFQIFEGRMLRLFNRGHREEEKCIQYLKAIGFTVWTVDENTGEQFRIHGAQGHYGGSADSVGLTPFKELDNKPILLEFKTHNRGSFSHLIKNGLILGKPQHYAQMCSYGAKFGFSYGMYYAVGKDDDDIYIEFVFLDPRHADDLSRKAEGIIYSQTAPPKISLQSSYYECKFCAMNGICHFHEPMEKNCRSCRNARPVDNAEWFCDRWQNIIPKDFIPTGCDQYYQIGE